MIISGICSLPICDLVRQPGRFQIRRVVPAPFFNGVAISNPDPGCRSWIAWGGLGETPTKRLNSECPGSRAIAPLTCSAYLHFKDPAGSSRCRGPKRQKNKINVLMWVRVIGVYLICRDLDFETLKMKLDPTRHEKRAYSTTTCSCLPAVGPGPPPYPRSHDLLERSAHPESSRDQQTPCR